MICFHRWSVTSKEAQESAFDQLMSAGAKDLDGLTTKWFRRDVIVTYQCANCGKEKVERV